MILIDMLHQFDVQGELIAMVPNRDTLIVTGSSNLPGLKIMAARARQALAEPRPISMLAFRLAEDEWEEWLPPDDHPLYHEYAILRLQSLGQQYAEQKEMLDAQYQSSGQALFVATYSGADNNQTGEVMSYCVWSEGVDSLLPKTDMIHFFRPDDSKDHGKIVVSCTWEAAELALKPLLDPIDIYPPCYPVQSFPTLRSCDG